MQTIRVHVPEETGMVLPIHIEFVPTSAAGDGRSADNHSSSGPAEDRSDTGLVGSPLVMLPTRPLWVRAGDRGRR